MKTDPAIQRTRDARREISASVADDPLKVVEYYIEMQRRFGARLRHASDARKRDGGAAEQRADPRKDAPS
jgi:hypothetical protein